MPCKFTIITYIFPTYYMDDINQPTSVIWFIGGGFGVQSKLSGIVSYLKLGQQSPDYFLSCSLTKNNKAQQSVKNKQKTITVGR